MNPTADRANANVRTILRSDDLTCPSCIRKIEHVLARTPGVERGRVHFATGRIEVHHDPAVVTPEALAEVVGGLGYRATPSPV